MKMRIKIFSFVLAFVMLLNFFTVLPTTVYAVDDGEEPTDTPQTQEPKGDNENYIEGMVKLTCEGSNYVSLKKGDKLYAFTTLDPSLGNNAKYSWQILGLPQVTLSL